MLLCKYRERTFATLSCVKQKDRDAIHHNDRECFSRAHCYKSSWR